MPIKLSHINYTYQYRKPFEKVALDDVSITFNDHDFTALIGKTGSGKSTLIQQLNGLLLPTHGEIDANGFIIDMKPEYKNGKINNRSLKKKHKKRLKDIKKLRKRVGIVFQFPEYQIFEESVLKDVSYGPKNFGASEEEAIEKAKEALNLVGINESYYQRSPFELSGGEKRRVAIAGILALNPEVLVLDEPTVGLDASGEDNLMNLIASLHKKGTSIIISTHNMDVVLKYANRAIVLDNGKIIYDSIPLKLFQDENFLSSSSLEPPKVFSFALELKKRGLDINLENIKDTHTLAVEIIKAKGEKK